MSQPSSSLALASWTTKAIDWECGPAYRRYEKARRRQYLNYFARHPELRCPLQAHSAKDLTAALPPSWGELETLIPQHALHCHARSGKSSQTLALALLGSAARLDPSLGWFWRALDLPTPVGRQHPPFTFERQLPSSLLNEKPRATVLDFAVDDPSFVVAVECKWTEAGLGTCSCAERAAYGPEMGGQCAEQVRSRQHYWQVAEQFFGLSAERLPLFGCPISPAYQAIRNVAAARKLADGKRPCAFVLLYDTENPYFHLTGNWPGWPAVLQAQLSGYETAGIHFRARSWQELTQAIPTDERTKQWAQEKHRLV